LTSTERVELIGTDGNTRLLESVGRGVYKISKVPFGDYYLRVDPGSLHAGGSRYFQVNKPHINVILGLPFLLAHGGFSEKHLSGAVDPRLLKKGRTWVKIVSLYSDFIREAMVNDSGFFYFDSIPTGSYLLLVFNNGVVCESKLLDVNLIGRSQVLSGELGKRCIDGTRLGDVWQMDPNCR